MLNLKSKFIKSIVPGVLIVLNLDMLFGRPALGSSAQNRSNITHYKNEIHTNQSCSKSELSTFAKLRNKSAEYAILGACAGWFNTTRSPLINNLKGCLCGTGTAGKNAVVGTLEMVIHPFDSAISLIDFTTNMPKRVTDLALNLERQFKDFPELSAKEQFTVACEAAVNVALGATAAIGTFKIIKNIKKVRALKAKNATQISSKATPKKMKVNIDLNKNTEIVSINGKSVDIRRPDWLKSKNKLQNEVRRKKLLTSIEGSWNDYFSQNVSDLKARENARKRMARDIKQADKKLSTRNRTSSSISSSAPTQYTYFDLINPLNAFDPAIMWNPFDIRNPENILNPLHSSWVEMHQSHGISFVEHPELSKVDLGSAAISEPLKDVLSSDSVLGESSARSMWDLGLDLDTQSHGHNSHSLMTDSSFTGEASSSIPNYESSSSPSYESSSSPSYESSSSYSDSSSSSSSSTSDW